PDHSEPTRCRHRDTISVGYLLSLGSPKSGGRQIQGNRPVAVPGAHRDGNSAVDQVLQGRGLPSGLLSKPPERALLRSRHQPETGKAEAETREAMMQVGGHPPPNTNRQTITEATAPAASAISPAGTA